MSETGWSLPGPARGTVALPAGFAAATGLAVALSGVRGADYPAHFLRAELWKRAGLGVWNNYWYGGHATPSYSVIVPPLVATVGAVALCLIASVAATACFARLLEVLLPADTSRLVRTLAGLSFAVCSTVNVIVGRVPFAVGLALAIGAALAWARRLYPVAAVLAAITPFASPVVATFTAIAAAAVGLDAWWQAVPRKLMKRRVGEAAGLVAASLAPLVVMALLFPGSGRFPFRFDQLVFSIVVMATTAYTVSNRAVRIGCVIAVLSSIVLFAVPNPLGGNFLRFTQFLVVPVAIVGVSRLHGRWAPAAWALVAGAVIWSAQYGVVSLVAWAGDDSVEAEYHQPLIDQILIRNTDGKPLGRVEIPFTDNHWESFFVASEVPYARGWERQTDLERNPELYDPELTRAEYHDWLAHNGVRWVALPSAPLDHGGLPEAEVLASWQAIEWLDLVWWSADWRLFEVVDYSPVVDPPARLVRQTPDEVVLATSRAAAAVTVRYEYSDDLAIEGPEGAEAACLIPHEHDGWMNVFLPAPGVYTIRAGAEALLPGVDTDACQAKVDEARAAVGVAE